MKFVRDKFHRNPSSCRKNWVSLCFTITEMSKIWKDNIVSKHCREGDASLTTKRFHKARGKRRGCTTPYIHPLGSVWIQYYHIMRIYKGLKNMLGRRPWSMNQWCLTMWTIPISMVQSRLQSVHHRVPRVIRMQKRWHAVSLWTPSCTGRDGLMLGIRPIIKGSESAALAVSNSKSRPLLFSSLPDNQTNLVTRRHTIEDDAGTVEAFRLTPLKRLSSLLQSEYWQGKVGLTSWNCIF